jgi:hypothetical protein
MTGPSRRGSWTNRAGRGGLQRDGRAPGRRRAPGQASPTWSPRGRPAASRPRRGPAPPPPSAPAPRRRSASAAQVLSAGIPRPARSGRGGRRPATVCGWAAARAPIRTSASSASTSWPPAAIASATWSPIKLPAPLTTPARRATLARVSGAADRLFVEPGGSRAKWGVGVGAGRCLVRCDGCVAVEGAVSVDVVCGGE